MQTNSSATLLMGLNVCGGDEDERDTPEQVDHTGGAFSNLSLNCWLHLLSKESTLELYGDSANLAVGV